MNDDTIYGVGVEDEIGFDQFDGEDVDFEDDYGEDYEDVLDYGEDYFETEAGEARRYSSPASRMQMARARALSKNKNRYGSRPRPRYSARPQAKPKNYYRSQPSQQPPSTSSVRNAFNQASRDIQNTQRAVKSVDLDNKVLYDKVNTALKNQSSRIDRNEYAQAATKVVDELKVQFPDLVNNSVIKTALPLVPLLFLKPQKKGTGFEAVISDPRVWGTGLAAGIALFKEVQRKDDDSPSVLDFSPNGLSIPTGSSSIPLSAAVKNRKGDIITGRNIIFTSLDPAKATVDANGNLTPLVAGTVTIMARDAAANLSSFVVVTVT